MSLSKRLESEVRELRMTEEKADAILRRREELWRRQEDSGQMLMDLTTKQLPTD